jgi:hypothetical protein
VAVLIFRIEWRYMRFVSPGAALRRLRRSESRSFSVEIRGVGWAWDPSPAASRWGGLRRVYGRGHAAYSLAHDDTISLHFTRSDGTELKSKGPIPPYLRPGTPEAAKSQRARRLAWAALTLFPVGGGAGFAVGFWVVSAPSTGSRAGHGLLGFFVGYCAVGLIFHFAAIIVGATAGKRDKPSTGT